MVSVLIFHYYVLYVGESFRAIVEHNDGHNGSFKDNFMFELQNTDIPYFSYKYSSLNEVLKKSKVIQPVLLLDFDRLVAEGVLDRHFRRFRDLNRMEYLNTGHCGDINYRQIIEALEKTCELQATARLEIIYEYGMKKPDIIDEIDAAFNEIKLQCNALSEVAIDNIDYVILMLIIRFVCQPK